MTHTAMLGGGSTGDGDAKAEQPINFNHDSFLEMKAIIQLSRLI
jgi:hypothetical protein